MDLIRGMVGGILTVDVSSARLLDAILNKYRQGA